MKNLTGNLPGENDPEENFWLKFFRFSKTGKPGWCEFLFYFFGTALVLLGCLSIFLVPYEFGQTCWLAFLVFNSLFGVFVCGFKCVETYDWLISWFSGKRYTQNPSVQILFAIASLGYGILVAFATWITSFFLVFFFIFLFFSSPQVKPWEGTPPHKPFCEMDWKKNDGLRANMGQDILTGGKFLAKTKKELVEKLGKPYDFLVSDGKEKWRYLGKPNLGRPVAIIFEFAGGKTVKVEGEEYFVSLEYDFIPPLK